MHTEVQKKFWTVKIAKNFLYRFPRYTYLVEKSLSDFRRILRIWWQFGIETYKILKAV